MAGKKKPYRKLSGNKFGLFFTNALWQGDDHLLRVEAGMMTERYWRFYFKDIQAVLLQRTRAHYFWSLLWGLLTMVWGTAFLIEPFTSPISLGFGLLFLLLLVVNLILGPGCRVHLQTAVQVQRLPALNRVRKARKIMNRIRDAAERFQGPLDLAASRPGGNRSTAAPIEGQFAYHQPPGSLAAVTPSASQGAGFTPWLHQFLFSTLLVGAVCYGWHLIRPHFALVVASHALLMVLIVWVIVVLVRNYDGMRGRFLMKMTWTVLVFIAVQGLVVYILYIVASIRNPQSIYDTRALFTAYMEFQLSDLPIRVGVTSVSAVIDLLLGGIGFLVLFTHKRPTPK